MTVSAPRERATARPVTLPIREQDQIAIPSNGGARPVVSGESDPRAVLVTHRRLARMGDLASAVAATALALGLRFQFDVSPMYIAYSVLVPLLWVAAVGIQRGYDPRFLGTGPEEYRRVANAGLVLFTTIAVFSYAFREEPARGYVFVAIPVTVLFSLMVRHRLRKRIYHMRSEGKGLQRVLVVGRADAAVAVIEQLDREPHHGLVPVGACVPPIGIEVSHVHGVPVVGDPMKVLEAVDKTQAHVVAIVSHPDMSGHALRRLSWALEERDVELIVSPGIIEVAGPRLSIRPVAGLSLLHLERPSASGGKMLLKAIFDRTLGAMLLTAIAPVLVAIAAAVKFTSPGPALYKQTRVGVHGNEFTMIKFRSMVVDAHQRKDDLVSLSDGNGVLFKMKDDPRVTRVGRFIRRYSLDELPQLINVVRGDMSLVGPRPPLPEEVAGYTSDAVRRLRVRPGVTGLWQVSGRSDLSWEESLRLDLRYADNWSIVMDLTILARTARAVFHGSGAY